MVRKSLAINAELATTSNVSAVLQQSRSPECKRKRRVAAREWRSLLTAGCRESILSLSIADYYLGDHVPRTM
jgi:hypothetical protein